MSAMIKWCAACWVAGDRAIMDRYVSRLPLCKACAPLYEGDSRLLKELRKEWEVMPDFDEHPANQEVEEVLETVAPPKSNKPPKPPVTESPVDIPTPAAEPILLEAAPEVKAAALDDPKRRQEELYERAKYIADVEETLMQLQVEISTEALEQFKEAAMLEMASSVLRKYGDRLRREASKLG